MRLAVLILAIAAVFARPAAAQQPQKPQSTRDVLLANWNEIG